MYILNCMYIHRSEMKEMERKSILYKIMNFET